MPPGSRRNFSGSPMPTSPTAPTICRRLVARAQSGDKVLVSLMARLSLQDRGRAFPDSGLRLFLRHAVSLRRGQRSASPRSRRRPAAACWRGASALEAAGGIDAIRHNIIDDCALGRAMKAQGPIWLGLTDRAVSACGPMTHFATSATWCRARPMPSSTIRRCCWPARCWGLFMVYIAPVMAALFAWVLCRRWRAGWPGSSWR